MKVTREKIENSQAYLTVEMEPAEMADSLEDSYRRLVKRANIPGFRKGKAPRSVVERYVGKESVLEEALKHLVPEAYEKAVKEQQIEPFARPDIAITQTDPVIFKATVPLSPKVELGDYQSIRLTPEPVAITDDNVSAVLEEIRHQQATWEPVERSSGYGDMVVLDINSQIEEKPFIKKAGAQYQILHDSISPAPGFAEQLVGMNRGEEKEFKLKYPEDYPQSNFAGKEASFKVKVEEIKEEKLPGLDDELARQVSPDFNTLDLLRTEVAKDLKLRADEQARRNFEEQVMNAVIDGAQVDFPPVMVEMEIDRLLNERARQMQMSGRGLDEYLKSIKKTEKELHEELRPPATRNVIGSLVLGKVAEMEKIEVGDSEVDAEITKMVSSTTENKRDEIHKLLNTPQMRGSIKQSLMARNTVERLGTIAKNEDKTQMDEKEEKK